MCSIDARRDGWEQFLPAAIAQYASALVDRDEPEAASRSLAPAISEASASAGPMLALLLEARSRVGSARGDARGAFQDAIQAGRLLNDSLMPNPALAPWRGGAAIAASLLGERERAIELAVEEVELASRFGAPRVIGMALRAAGVAQGGSDGVRLLSEAVETRGLTGETRAGAGARRSRRGAPQGARGVAAREPLHRGLDMAIEFGARALERRAREELAASGGRPRRSAARRANALTPSVLRIAESAARGLSNRRDRAVSLPDHPDR